MSRRRVAPNAVPVTPAATDTSAPVRTRRIGADGTRVR
ncbi:hypothetical protein SAMN05444320_102217 [Streptoalloteichus hindustanus]|uniref:Uncharacterized protein n=1 Tax=Streptoalloteichus hindustanus TaxID=2017 RepID=A0A1M4Y357_STRHI|nr:hypothetical protein SAMN05444320_102217 [Streptoalloteichus hindustanus]